MQIVKWVYRKLIPEGSGFQFFLWKYRHWFDRRYAHTMADSADLAHPHRQKMAELLQQSAPFDHLLEIGCGKGTNLFLLSGLFPNARFTGVDINPKAIRAVEDYIKHRKIRNIYLRQGTLTDLHHFTDQQFDVILCDAVLIYVDQKRIMQVASELVRIARKQLFLVEYFDELTDAGGYSHDNCWVRNYASLFQPYSMNIRLTEIEKGTWTENWERFGRLIQIELKKP